MRVMETITTFIEKKLGLIVNVTKSKVAKPNEIKYLGFGFYKNRQGQYRSKPHLKSVLKFKRKLKSLLCRSWSIKLDDRFIKLKQLIYGWVNYFRIADMKTLLDKTDAHIRRKMRVIIWKQWKLRPTRYKNLVKLGVPKGKARMLAWSSKSYWRLSHNPTIHIAISNDRLNKRGLVSTLIYYLKVHTVI